MAENYPRATVVGFDTHEDSILAARKRADASLTNRVRFEVASAKTFEGSYDLVCFSTASTTWVIPPVPVPMAKNAPLPVGP
jgi:trans-aconitate methyltransferase